MPRKRKPEPEWESEIVRHYQAMRLNGMTELAGRVLWNELWRQKETFTRAVENMRQAKGEENGSIDGSL